MILALLLPFGRHWQMHQNHQLQVDMFLVHLVQVFLIHEPLSFFSVIGAILVFASSVIVAVRKIITTKEPTAPPIPPTDNEENVSLKEENIDKEK